MNKPLPALVFSLGFGSPVDAGETGNLIIPFFSESDQATASHFFW